MLQNMFIGIKFIHTHTHTGPICHSRFSQILLSLWHVNTHIEGLVMYVKGIQYFYNNSNVCIIKNQKRIRFIAKQDKIPQTTYWLNVKSWSEARTLSVGRNCPDTVICN